MKIIAGKHRSRVLNTLEGLNTRPMMSRMKESIFNTIGPYFDGDTVLDLFGGSGQLSLEAISRGAKEAFIIEKDYKASKIIESNIKMLHEEASTHLYQIDYKVALNKFKSDEIKFDIIFLDPPYRMNIMDELISFIEENDLLNNGGVVICQYVRGNYTPHDSNYLFVKKNYTYASSEVAILKKREKDE